MSSPAPFPRPPSCIEGVLTWAKQVSAYLRTITPYSSPSVRANLRIEGTTFDVDAASSSPAAAATPYPWQPYLSPWLGAGDDPNADTRKMRIAFLRGMVNSRTPTNMGTEFLCFGDAEDDEIEYDDAVVTKFYLSIPLETDTGNVLKATIMSVEAMLTDDLIDLISPPAFTGDALPPYVIYPICEVLYYGGALTFSPGLQSYLSAQVIVVGVAEDGDLSRGIQFSRT